IRRGTSFIAGPPTASPSPGLVTTPTPSPRSRCIPGSSHGETRAVRCAPSVTSGSSPASLTTTASAQVPSSPTSHRSTGKRTRRSSPLRGSFMSTSSCACPLAGPAPAPGPPHHAPFGGEADAPLFALAGKLYVYLFLRLAACQRPRGGLGG